MFNFSMSIQKKFWRLAAGLALVLGALLPAGAQVVRGTSTDLAGPAGSGAFGSGVFVLPNGNLVVTDPLYSPPGVDHAGAVYLYDGDTHDLISTLTGSQAEDQVGSDGITILNDGSYVVKSNDWANGAEAKAGAVTWCPADLGCSGEVSPANSLVGGYAEDQVGYYGVTLLEGEAFLVRSPSWNSGAGALTYCQDGPGCTGEVSADNSLIGSTAGDSVGALVYVLPGDGYVTYAANWDSGGLANVGAVTGCPMTGCTGHVTFSNSLHGTRASDAVGAILTPLKGGGFVASNIYWQKPEVGKETGAATYCASATACNGQEVTAANSLTGQFFNSFVGGNILALPNGDYVVGSSSWRSSLTERPGAATYCHVSGGASDCTGQVVSPANSLVGTHNNDSIGGGLVALEGGGGYLVSSSSWDSYKGAVTFCPVSAGTSSCTGQTVTAANSLVGSNSSADGFNGDQVGRDGMLALSGGGYVVNSSFWDLGSSDKTGAVTYCPPTGCTGPVSAANSLTGSAANDQVGMNWSRQLTTGNYVVMSLEWANGDRAQAGAVTFCSVSGDSATSSCTGQTVSAVNSLVGDIAGDKLSSSYNLVPLSNGGYLIGSPDWTNGTSTAAGAITFCPPGGCAGPITAANSLLGTEPNEMAGWDYYTEVEDGYYVAPDAGFNGTRGSVSLCSIETGCANPITSENSVLGGVPISDWTLYMTYEYDAVHHQLVVGRPAENIVTFFTLGSPKTDTTTTLTSSSPGGASEWGQAVTLTAEVSPAEATGTVTFMAGSTALCSDVPLDAGNRAACTKSDLLVGANSLTAEYSGDDSHNPSTSNTVTQEVSKADLLVTADGKSKVYGETDPAFTFQYSGFVNGEAAGDIDEPPSCSVAVPHVNIGPYAITCSGGEDTHYEFSYSPGTLTILARPVTVTADPQSKVYGESDPVLTYKITSGSLASGDGFGGALARAAGENAGEYAIQQSTLSLSNNYDLTYSGATLTIQPKPAAVTPDAASKVYGSPDPTFTGSLTGFLEADGVTAAYSRTAGETVSGGPYAISAVLSPANVLDNYTITYNTAPLTISKKPASVTPHPASKTYGDSDPAFSGTLTGFLVSDGVSATYNRFWGESVADSPYGITGHLSPHSVLENYTITYNTANFTITRRPVTAGAEAKSKGFGDPDPALTYQITSGSLVAGDAFTGSLTREPGEAIGSYAIQQGTLALDSNYDLTFTGANLTIGKPGTTTSISASADSPGYRQPITLTAWVGLIPPRTGTVAGSVDFMDGTTILAADVPLVDGEAQVVLDDLTVGSHQIRAIYTGSETYASSTSTPVSVSVQKAAVTVTISSALGQKTKVNEPYSVSVSVTSPVGIPTGSVTVSDGTDECTIDLGTETACTLTSSTVGDKTITATYSGDATFSGGEATVDHPIVYWLILFLIFSP
jgi:hypothetical protein